MAHLFRWLVTPLSAKKTPLTSTDSLLLKLSKKTSEVNRVDFVFY
jgi:hypothetical protein